MKKQFSFALVFLLFTLSVGKKDFPLSDNTRKVRQQLNYVELCPSACVYQDAENSWCFITNTPELLRIGWDFKQEFSTEAVVSSSTTVNTKFWAIKFRPFG